MNTHDIELPPLPEHDMCGEAYAYSNDAMQDYARAAIEADRQRRGSIVNNASASSEPYAQLIVVDEDDAWPQLVYLKGVNLAIGVHNLYLTPQPADQECSRSCGTGDVSGEYPGQECPVCNGTGEVCSGTIDGIPELFDCGKCDGTGVATPQPTEPGGYVHTVPDDCETLHWRGQILSLNELAAISAEPVKALVESQEPLGKEFQRILDDNRWDLYMKGGEPVKVQSALPSGTNYSVKPHGNGYAIYQGRDQFHHGLNLAHLTECTPEFSKRIESALNAMSEPVVADAPVPSDSSTHMWKKIEEYSREMDGKKIDIYLGDFLLYCPELEDEENNGVVIGYYSEPYKGWYTSETLEEVFPTHFMPLPEKPL